MQEKKIYSEKLGKDISISQCVNENESRIIMEDVDCSMVGWTHNGWNYDNGGASRWKKYVSTVRNKFLTVMALWRKDEKRCICCNLLYMQ